MYLVTGFFVTKTFHFVALKQNTNDVEHILMESLVIGYVCCRIAYIIPLSISPTVDNILIITVSIIAAFLIGKLFTNSSLIVKILDILQIRDTCNIYIWDDLMDTKYGMKICIESDDMIYEGYAHQIESYTNTPHIALALCQIKDRNGKIIEDNSKNPRKIIVLDSGTAKYVKVIYDEKSDITKDIKQFMS